MRQRDFTQRGRGSITLSPGRKSSEKEKDYGEDANTDIKL
jgi:hypothetical protein